MNLKRNLVGGEPPRHVGDMVDMKYVESMDVGGMLCVFWGHDGHLLEVY